MIAPFSEGGRLLVGNQTAKMAGKPVYSGVNSRTKVMSL